MAQYSTPTQIIEIIQKMDVPHHLQTKLNNYIAIRDKLIERRNNLNTLSIDYKNKLNQYSNMDKRKKQAKQLKQEISQLPLTINNETQSILNDREALKNNLLLLINEINEYNVMKEIDELEQHTKNEIKNKFKSVKPIKPRITKEHLKQKKQTTKKES